MKEAIKRSHCQNNAEITVIRNSEGKKSRTIEGYAIRFNSPSVPFCEDEDARVVEYIAPEAVTDELLRNQDVKMTLYHNAQRLLARSKKGEGTLSYTVDERGVKFRFDAPNTADGNMALELVDRGDIDGCSFMFSTFYSDREYVSREVRTGEDGKREIVYIVRKITGIYDFTLTPDPAYPDTTVNAAKRDMTEPDPEIQKSEEKEEKEEKRENPPFDMDQYLHLIKLSKTEQ